MILSNPKCYGQNLSHPQINRNTPCACNASQWFVNHFCYSSVSFTVLNLVYDISPGGVNLMISE